MRKKSTLPTPILGVCTLPSIRRPVGVAEAQVNFRSNLQHSLSRRARMAWKEVLLEGDVNVKHHYMKRNGKKYRVLLESSGAIHVSVDGVVESGTVPAGYMGSLADMQIEQINDTVFILNTAKRVRMSTSIEGLFNQPTHINVTTALAYEGFLELSAKRVTSNGTVVAEKIVSYSVAAVDYVGGDYGAADVSRSTNAVAAEIWRQLNDFQYTGILSYVTSMRTELTNMQNSVAWMGPHAEGGPAWTAEAARIGGMFAALDALLTDIVSDMSAASGTYLSTATNALNRAQEAEDAAEIVVTNSRLLIEDIEIELDVSTYATWQTDTNNVTYTNALFLIPPYDTAPEIIVLNDLKSAHVTNIGILNTKIADRVAAELVVANSGVNAVAYTVAWNRLPSLFTAWRNALNDAGTAVFHPYHTPVGVDSHRAAGLAAVAAAEAAFASGEQPFSAIVSTDTFSAFLLGNNVDVFAPGVSSTDTVVISVTKGMGEKNLRIVSPVTGNIDNMPLYAIPYSLVQVVPDPDNKNSGNYYIEATPVKNETGASMVEVIWTETRSPWIKNEIDADTMPMTVSLEPTVEFSWIVEANWRDRLKGDETSCPNPSFVNETITNISYFQKRLMFLSGNNVVMSETNDIWNFYKASALKLLVSDPVDIASSATGIDSIKWAVPHNKDMLVFARNAQFKIVGTQPVTPETVSMAMTTKFDMQDSVKPVSAGNLVFFPVDYGESSGVFEYTAQPYTGQDMSGELTAMVKGYIKGDIKLLRASANLRMIFCVADAGNIIYVCEQFQWQNGRWNSWSKWEFHVENSIIDLYLDESKLWVVSKTSTGVVLKSVKLGRLE